MELSRAEQQFLVLRIRNGTSVDPAELTWAVEQGYFTIDDEGDVRVTDAGQQFLGVNNSGH